MFIVEVQMTRLIRSHRSVTTEGLDIDVDRISPRVGMSRNPLDEKSVRGFS